MIFRGNYILVFRGLKACPSEGMRYIVQRTEVLKNTEYTYQFNFFQVQKEYRSWRVRAD